MDGREFDGSRLIVEFSTGGRPRVPGEGRCFACNRSGHWARDCPDRFSSRGGSSRGGGSRSSYSRDRSSRSRSRSRDRSSRTRSSRDRSHHSRSRSRSDSRDRRSHSHHSRSRSRSRSPSPGRQVQQPTDLPAEQPAPVAPASPKQEQAEPAK
eukprot:TRINITY_DN463_c0_g4_i1.p1 TRINITY_DN463_c0_g4~~TRINITY_DN463_c0_g4_i1.p1  ORF type:complete len:153 (-),score=5.57 TRINITY_DN463_c0_g4_i1:110-568(-)